MDYRRFGNTGLKVPPLCLGSMMFGSWGNPDHEECVRIIRSAVDSGLNFIDTSNNYSDGESEIIVGKAIAGIRDQVTLATKVWAPVGPGPNDRGLSRKAILTQVENSLRRLQVDYVDLYQIHRPDPTTPWEETLSALTDLVRTGKVRYIGCSTNHHGGEGPWERKLPAWEIVQTLWISQQHGFERFVSLQPPYSLLRRTMELEHFPVTRRFGMANIVWSPLEGGFLTGKYRQGSANPGDSPRSKSWIGDTSQPRFAHRLEVIEKLVPMAQQLDITLAELALAWTLVNPDVTCAIIGPRIQEQLDSALRALEVTLPDDLLRVIDELVPPGTTAL